MSSKNKLVEMNLFFWGKNHQKRALKNPQQFHHDQINERRKD